MSGLNNWRIGTRLGAGFGVVLAFLVAIILFAAYSLNVIQEGTSSMLDSDLVKLEAANTVNAYTRANGLRAAALTLETDPVQIQKTQQFIASNNKTLDDAFLTLKERVKTSEGKALLATIVEARTSYNLLFDKFEGLLRDGKREDARQVFIAEILPALDMLRTPLADFVALETKRMVDSGAAERERIAAARAWMLALGALSIMIGGIFAWWLTRSIKAAIDHSVGIATNIADGKLNNRITLDRADEFGQLLKALQIMDQKLCDIVGSVIGTAESVGSAAREIARGNDDLSSRTQQQASALEQTAATMEEMTATVKRNADNASQADQLGRQARNRADHSSGVAQRTVAAMADINTASRKINDIINVIDEIAFQTNLLALNAAVEAARAGEQGRGFAVVASEVRNLAQRSASAAKEIKTLINDTVAKVENGTELVNTSGKALDDIVTDVKRVTDIVAEIAAASAEQAKGIDQVNLGITDMDNTTQQNAALVEEAASASKLMEDQAQELVQQISFFRIEGQASTRSATASTQLGNRAVTTSGISSRRSPALRSVA